jgi:hypothetical protein
MGVSVVVLEQSLILCTMVAAERTGQSFVLPEAI